MELLFKIEDFPVKTDPLTGVPNRNSRKYKDVRDAMQPEYIYEWNVSHYLGREVHSGDIDFQPDLRNFPSVGVISSDVFIKNLNQWKCFGTLDYLPLEGDCVTIRYSYVDFAYKGKPNLSTLEWMQAIFKDGIWVRDRYYHEKLETVAEGILYIK
jgi:hypothetical protein